MPRNTYDRLIDDDSAKTKQGAMQRRPWLTDELNFAEWALDFVLDRYGLAGTRTKFMLMDAYRRRTGEEYHHASLFDFCNFFPDYPIALNSIWLTRDDSQRMTVPRFFLGLDKIAALGHAWDEAEDYARYREDGAPPIAVVIGGMHPKVAIEDSLVIHMCTMNVNANGGHFLFVREDGLPVAVEPFRTFLDAVDDRCPPEEWMQSAEDSGFRSPVKAGDRA